MLLSVENCDWFCAARTRDWLRYSRIYSWLRCNRRRHSQVERYTMTVGAWPRTWHGCERRTHQFDDAEAKNRGVSAVLTPSLSAAPWLSASVKKFAERRLCANDDETFAREFLCVCGGRRGCHCSSVLHCSYSRRRAVVSVACSTVRPFGRC